MQLCWWTLQKNILKRWLNHITIGDGGGVGQAGWGSSITDSVWYTWLDQCVFCTTGTSDEQVTWEAVISMGREPWTSRNRCLFKKQVLQQHGTATAPGYFPLTQNCLTHEPLISVKHTHKIKKQPQFICERWKSSLAATLWLQNVSRWWRPTLFTNEG